MPSQGEPLIDTDANRDLLAGVDHAHVAKLCRAFDIMAEKLDEVGERVTYGTAMWALATLVAKILAATDMQDGGREEIGQRFAAMLKLAYPAMVRALEDVRRRQEGLHPNDA
jgi:hypothetical protein